MSPPFTARIAENWPGCAFLFLQRIMYRPHLIWLLVPLFFENSILGNRNPSLCIAFNLGQCFALDRNLMDVLIQQMCWLNHIARGYSWPPHQYIFSSLTLSDALDFPHILETVFASLGYGVKKTTRFWSQMTLVEFLIQHLESVWLWGSRDLSDSIPFFYKSVSTWENGDKIK